MAHDKQGEGRIGRGLTDHLYIDVDDTLLKGLTREVLSWAFVDAVKAWYRQRHDHGASPVIVIWSVGGMKRAQEADVACKFTEEGYAVANIAKPDLMIDNGGHEWFYRKFKVVHPDTFR